MNRRIEILNRESIYNIVYSSKGSGNAEIDKKVKKYFDGENRQYLKLIKYYYLKPTTNREAQCSFSIKLNEFKEIDGKIIDDIRHIIWDYYDKRERKYKRNPKVVDLLTYVK